MCHSSAPGYVASFAYSKEVFLSDSLSLPFPYLPLQLLVEGESNEYIK